MALWTTLATSTAYTTQLTTINDRDVDLVKGLDPAKVTVSSPLTDSIRWNSANKRLETYNGSSWVEWLVAATDAYAMTVTGHRGGNFYGTITNNGTISGGTGNFTTLQVSGSSVWTAASLTNLNQLTNGPSYLTAASLTTYALLAGPAFTGAPTAPTAAVDTNTGQLATTAFVIGQGYAKTSALTSVYAPLGGAGTSGTWGISVTGNAATVTQRTFSNVRTDGINRGTYGAISVGGSNGSYSGIDFTAYTATLMVNATISGILRNDTTWDWYWDSGVLIVGTVPYARLSGAPTNLSAFTNGPGYITSGGSVAFATSAGSATTATSASSAATAAQVSGTAANTGASFTASGLIKGNSATSGNLGLGAITVSSTTGPRSGMVAGDLHGVY